MVAEQVLPCHASDLTSGRVYRYRRFQGVIDALRLLLVAGDIRFSDPRRFNDPWDCRPLYYAQSDDLIKRVAIAITAKLGGRDLNDSSISPDEVRTIAEEAAKVATNPPSFDFESAKLTDEQQAEIRKRYRLLCLSAEADEQLLWSHYADAHRGICLIFDAKSPVIGKARRVDYFDTYPEAVPDARIPSDSLKLMFLNKASYWAYEAEYRTVACLLPPPETDFVKCDRSSYVSVGPTALVGVIFGCEMAEDDRNQLMALLENSAHPVELHRAKRNHSDYGLTIERLK